MILLADGGSTKVDWCVIYNGTLIKSVSLAGANPFFRSKQDICKEIKEILTPQLQEYTITSVHFYGAGCNSKEKSQIIEYVIAENFRDVDIKVESDLLGAARALCGKNKGIVSILGTGSNSCFYDGNTIVEQVSPLGYILGDEGSGAVLGRLFIGACIKNQLSPKVKQKFFEYIKMTQSEILDRVYKQPMPNMFLASISPFILHHISDKSVYNLVYSSLKEFFVKNIMQYDYRNNIVHFTGSISYYYANIIEQIANDLDVKVGTIVKSPLEGLINYIREEGITR